MLLLLFDLICGAILLFLSLLVEGWITGGTIRVILLQMLVKIGGIAALGMRYFYEPQIRDFFGGGWVRPGLIIWLVGFTLGQIFIAVAVTDRNGELESPGGRACLRTGRFLRSWIGIRRS